MRLPIVSCLLAFVGLCACEGTPDYRLGFPAGDAQDLGAVRITERAVRIIEVENTGLQPITLEALTLERGWSGVLTIDPDASGCVPGLTLAVAERCSLGVAFEPANDITYGDWLHVDYRPDEGTPYAHRATLGVSGVGVLDCSVRAEYASSFEEGVAEAEARIVVDVAEATAAGAALTAEDGYSDGYASSYDVSYEEAYQSAYDDGSAQGYDDGYVDGASADACREGEVDGYADGTGAGFEDGEVGGVLEGNALGYDEGYAVGSFDGETDGCGFAEKVDPDPSLPGKCVDQGYVATYSANFYSAAYAAAVAANIAYLDGVSRGEREGSSEGQVAGDAEGYADGYRDGAELGLADGDADQYEACYLIAFEEGYEDGYLDAYNAFFIEAYEGAYDIGYEDGYVVGFRICG